MDTVADFFNCCGKDIKEEEISVSVADRRRAHSEGNKKTARIKRSLGKGLQNSHLIKQQNNITLFTVTGTSSNKHHEAKFKQGLSIATIEASDRSKELSLTGTKFYRDHYHLSKCQSEIFEMGKEIQDNTSKQMEKKKEKVYNIQSCTIQAQPPAIRGGPPRLLIEKRAKKKEQELKILVRSDKETLKLTSSKRYPFVTSVLEPIEERLSLLSCSESQAIDLSGMKDRSMVHHEVIDRLPDISPISEKYGSCMFERESFQTPTLKSAKSENMQSFERKFASDNESLLYNKLKIDLDLHEKQLNSLKIEEKNLIDQSQFSRKAFEQKLERLEYLKKQLNLTLKQLEYAKKTGIVQFQKPAEETRLFVKEESSF